MARRAPIGNDSGFGVLEALVVLVIIAGVIAVLATAMRPPQGGTALSDITRFVDQARLNAIETGSAVVLTLARDHLSAGGRAIQWDSAFITVRTDGSDQSQDSGLVIYPDGSFSGQITAAQTGGRSIVLSAIVRGAMP